MKGICARLSNRSTNLMGKAMNNLISVVKSHNARIRENVKLLIKSLRDKEFRFLIMAYNGLKEKKLIADGVGVEFAETRSIRERVCNR
jgi:hypothetical protein